MSCDWVAIADAHQPLASRCVGCGTRNALSLVSVAQGGAQEIVSACANCRPWARRHYVNWLDHWARKDAANERR